MGACCGSEGGDSGGGDVDNSRKDENKGSDESSGGAGGGGGDGDGGSGGGGGGGGGDDNAGGNGVLIRRDIRELSQDEQERFVAVCKEMMKLKDGESSWQKIGDIHGRHCVHGQETFPAWHRAYMIELEKIMREVDEGLGNDGNITLPYWDWTKSVNGEFVPKIIFDEIDSLPDHINVRINRTSPGGVQSRLRGVDDNVFDALESAEHWRFASTRWAGWDGPSIEVSHNNVHVALGYPMGTVQFAAFDPMFYLHHCNVDRIYEAYIQEEKDSQREFELFQDSLVEDGGEEDRFEAPLIPFKLNGKDFHCKDTFDIKKLGYGYDKLPPHRPQALKSPPTVAHFKDVDIMAMEGKTFQLHVFVTEKGEEGELKIPDSVEDYMEHDNYAGMGAVFGRGEGCTECEKRPPFQVMVDITGAVQKLDISRYDAALKVMCVVTTDPDLPVCDLEDTPVPVPVIVGPAFESHDTGLKQEQDQREEEVKVLQAYLQRFGHYDSVLDGDFGPNTDAALKSYQELAGLKVDGWAGPNTFKQLLAARCYNPDDDEEDDVKRDQELSYWLGVQPGRLDRDKTLEEIQKAFDTWGEVCGVSFNNVDSKDNADIKVQWTLKWANERDGMFPFDGKGQTLARGAPDYLNFDRAETWLLQGEEAKKDGYYLLPVAIHEIGHCLGLTHSSDPNDMMAPYYQPEKLELSENDTNLIKEKYAEDDDGGDDEDSDDGSDDEDSDGGDGGDDEDDGGDDEDDGGDDEDDGSEESNDS